MIDYKNKLHEITQDYLNISEKYLSDKEYSDINTVIYENILERINSLEPKIMVYGIYNAGKSTLINALKGENICVVGDRPETFKVTPYEWGGYTIIDAPGVNVPIKEHEIVSEAHLKKSDIVLFVISTNGTFDEERNYIEMNKIIKSSKKMIIILNNKDGYEKNDPEIINIQSKILSNLKKFSENENIGDKYEVLLVDAKTALEAKTEFEDDEETKNILINESNIQEIEKKFLQSFKEIKVFDILKTPIHNLNEEINTLANLIQNKLDNNSQKEIININNYYQDLIENFSISIEKEISEFVSNYTDLISTKILNEEDITPILDNISNMYKSALLRSIDKIKMASIENKEVKVCIDEGIDQIKSMIENPNMNNKNNHEFNYQDDFNEIQNYSLQEIAVTSNTSFNLLESATTAMFQKEALDKLGTAGVKEVTKLAGTELGKKFLGGKVAAKVLTTLNPAIGIVTTVMSVGTLISMMNKDNGEQEYLQAQQIAAAENRRAQEEANKRALRLQHANSSAKSIMFETESILKNSLSMVYIQLKDFIDSKAKEIIDLSKHQEDRKIKDIKKLEQLKYELIIIKNNI